MTPVRKDRRVHCNQCGPETKHLVLAKHSQEESFTPEQTYPVAVTFGSDYFLLECRGCGAVTLQKTDWCSEDDPSTRRAAIFYPPRLSRRKPAWMERAEFPREYSDLLEEVYLALHADSRRLAAMGARTLIDIHIRRRIGDRGNFSSGLSELVARGFLSESSRQLIDAAVDAGNASAHRGYFPSSVGIDTVIDIVENLIQNELLASAADALKAATPQRPSRIASRAKSKK